MQSVVTIRRIFEGKLYYITSWGFIYIIIYISVENSKTTIVTQEMDKSFAITLEYIKLSEYQWFFNNFSYEEILQINTTNIYWYIEKTSVKHTMSPSVVNKICIMASILKQRSHKIKYMLRVCIIQTSK